MHSRNLEIKGENKKNKEKGDHYHSQVPALKKVYSFPVDPKTCTYALVISWLGSSLRFYTGCSEGSAPQTIHWG